MENAFSKVSCPICGSLAASVWVKEGYRIARCSACRTLFVEDPPPDTTHVYDESYFFSGERCGGYGSYDEEKEAMRRTFERALDMVGHEKPRGALLDVGAATGYFMHMAKMRGYDVSGIDISAAATKSAREKGLEVQVGTLETVVYPPEAFDAVTMFDVLEHVSSPKMLLRQVHALLKPSGVVFGSTPDSGSVNARLMGKRWHMLLPPEHLVLMNDKSLRLALKKEGFETLWTGRLTKRFSAPYILQTASRWLKIPLLARIGSSIRGTWLAKIAIPLDLRDNLFFLARKI